MSGTTSLLFGGEVHDGEGVVDNNPTQKKWIALRLRPSKISFFLKNLFQTCPSVGIGEIGTVCKPHPNFRNEQMYIKSMLHKCVEDGDLVHNNGVFTLTDQPVFNNVQCFMDKYFHKDPSYSTQISVVMEHASNYFGKPVSMEAARSLFHTFNYEARRTKHVFRGYRVCPPAQWEKTRAGPENILELFFQTCVAYDKTKSISVPLVEIARAYINVYQVKRGAVTWPLEHTVRTIQTELRRRGFQYCRAQWEVRSVYNCQLREGENKQKRKHGDEENEEDEAPHAKKSS